MRNLIIYGILMTLFNISCKEVNNTSQIASTEKANIDSSAYKVPEKVESIDYTYAWNHVSGIKIGDEISKLKKDERFNFKEASETLSDEGYEYVINKLIAMEGGIALFELHYSENPSVEEIIILSNKLKNNEKIGVGNTLQDFVETYPHAKAYYSYVSGDHMWLENGFKGLQYEIIVPNSFYEAIEVNSDLMEIPLEKIPVETEISSIRLYGNEMEHDITGSWQSSDKEVKAEISKNGDYYHIELSTGKDIYNKFSQDLYPNSNSLYTLPSEEDIIEIYTYEFPNSIHLFLDDHPELEPMRVQLLKKP